MNIPGAAARARRPFNRSELFFWLVLLGALNGFAGIAIRIVPEHGLQYAIFELFGISAIIWVALGASLALLWNDSDPAAPVAADRLVAYAIMPLIMAPVATAGALALTALTLYMIGTAKRGSAVRRAGIIGLTITGSLLWGRLLLAMFSRPMLDIDSWFVAKLVGAHQVGNTISFLDETGRIIVAPGCSSWQGMSLALVCWATVNQWYGVRLGWGPIGWCAAALGATLGINVLRIAAMVRFPVYLEEIHTGYGAHVAMWTTLIAVCALCIYGARREIFLR